MIFALPANYMPTFQNRCSEILTFDGDGKLILYINYIRGISIP